MLRKSSSSRFLNCSGNPMCDGELDILAHRRASISAPAGCGKTQLITTALLRCSNGRPALVLTHTNAGRASSIRRAISGLSGPGVRAAPGASSGADAAGRETARSSVGIVGH